MVGEIVTEKAERGNWQRKAKESKEIKSSQLLFKRKTQLGIIRVNGMLGEDTTHP